jgi:hypothetical protein
VRKLNNFGSMRRKCRTTNGRCPCSTNTMRQLENCHYHVCIECCCTHFVDLGWHYSAT